MSVALPEYAPFTPKDHPDDTARWSTWFEGFDAMVGAMNVQEDCEASEEDKRPASKQWYRLFIHYIGEDCRKLLKQLENNGAANKDYAMAHTALTKHFSPALNRIYQLNVLSEQIQNTGESMDSFYHRVKEKIDAMKLTELSKENIIELMTMSQLVNNCTDISAKRKAIKDNQSLKEFLASARAFERTEQQMKQMETRPVHVISKGGKSNSYKSTTKEPTNCGACGYAHLYGKGKDYLVVVDYFSKYPELSPLKDKTASTIIMKLKSIFARHGIPGILMSDNMPYASSEFRTFAKEWGIELHTSSPLYPQPSTAGIQEYPSHWISAQPGTDAYEQESKVQTTIHNQIPST